MKSVRGLPHPRARGREGDDVRRRRQRRGFDPSGENRGAPRCERRSRRGRVDGVAPSRAGPDGGADRCRRGADGLSTGSPARDSKRRESPGSAGSGDRSNRRMRGLPARLSSRAPRRNARARARARARPPRAGAGVGPLGPRAPPPCRTSRRISLKTHRLALLPTEFKRLRRASSRRAAKRARDRISSTSAGAGVDNAGCVPGGSRGTPPRRRCAPTHPRGGLEDTSKASRGKRLERIVVETSSNEPRLGPRGPRRLSERLGKCLAEDRGRRVGTGAGDGERSSRGAAVLLAATPQRNQRREVGG